MAKKISQLGFTLTEVLVSITIFVLIIVVIYSIYIFNQRSYQEGEQAAEINQNGRVILERMTREIRQAKEIVTNLPQAPDNPGNPAPSEIEFQDGHTPYPYQALGSDYYYIRYFIPEGSNELKRQYRVYCFEECDICNTYFRWNDTRLEGQETTHPCNLEEIAIGECVSDLKFWGVNSINIFISLSKNNKEINLKTNVLGRNL
jgi:prepilin-type N-terminal cleavage/methylation domain-containing protein